MKDVPDLPNFSHFHEAYRGDAGKKTPEGDMRTAFFGAYDAAMLRIRAADRGRDATSG